MADFKHIMALLLDGASYSMIASRAQCSNRDIVKVKTVIASEGITKDSFARLSPDYFVERFADGRQRRKHHFDQPDYHALAARLKANKHLTRHKLWMDYVATACDPNLAKYEYSQFCDGLRDFIVANDLVAVIEHEPGQELYVDWAGDKISIIDQATGQVALKASLFVAVCPYSGLMFATATVNQKMEAWIDCHVQTLTYIGKLPAIIVPDHASTATYRPRKGSRHRRLTDRYADFAAYYDVLIVPARPGKPRDKAAVERAVQIAYTQIYGYFDGETFFDLDDLNTAISERVAAINNDLVRADGTTRRGLFDSDEAPLMRELPEQPFTEVSWRSAKVDRNWHITCDYQYYSVPFRLVGTTVRVRLTKTLVSVFTEHGELVAEHTRLSGFRYRYSTDPAHAPSGNDDGHNVLTRDELLAWAGSFGTATTQVITAILDRNQASQPRGLLQARNILANLGRKHNKTTLEPACQTIIDNGLAPNMAVIKRIQSDIATKPPSVTQHRERAHNRRTRSGSRHVDVTTLADAVFIRPASHFDTTTEVK